MQQVADWLEKLGLSEYAARFAENGIDVSVLRYLTDQDLKDIGVLLGHRRKMLAAISELSGAIPGTTEAAAEAQPKIQNSAERRQVTVMFSDLVGSTALSARMDPEDLREIIAAYHKCVAEIVRRFDGFVAQYLGDGVLVYFGYPQAHEDDAERAVRSGLEVTAAVSGLKTRASLQTRVGIATGQVVVGDLMASGNAPERGIIGETPNLAARLQGTRRAEHGRDRRKYAKASRQSLRTCRPRGKRTQRDRWASTRLGGAAAKIHGKPLRGSACDRPDGPGRTGRRIATTIAALGESQGRRRPGGTALWGAWNRQIAAHGRAAGKCRCRAAHPPAPFVLSAAY